MDEITRFIKSLRYYRLTSQQRKTLRGQALDGDIAGAKTGLQRITHRGRRAVVAPHIQAVDVLKQ